MLESLRSGVFGQVSQETIDEYRAACHTVFPYANAFKLDLPNGTMDDVLGDSDAAVTTTAVADDCVDCVA